MEFEQYRKILLYGEKTDWFGVEVPKDLITPLVRFASESLSNEINKLESEMDDLQGTTKDKRKFYLEVLRNNLRNLPYELSGDVLLTKKKRIYAELESEKKNKINKKSKNSNLIFGKNK